MKSKEAVRGKAVYNQCTYCRPEGLSYGSQERDLNRDCKLVDQ